MLTITLSLLIGAAIGLRFRIHVLLAAIAMAVVIVAATGMGHSYGLVAILGELAASIFALQVGYFLGALGRLPAGLCPAVQARRPVGKLAQAGALARGSSSDAHSS